MGRAGGKQRGRARVTHPISDADQAAMERERKRVVNEAKLVNRALGAVVVVLGAIFGIGKLKDVPTLPMLEDTWARFFFNLALWLYFFAWIAGARSDLGAQERVIQRLQGFSGRIRKALALAGLLVAVFVALSYVHGFIAFCGALGVFLAMDCASWWLFYRRILKPLFDDSRTVASANPWLIRQIDIVDRYMSGRWRYVRWAVTGALLAALGAASALGTTESFAIRVGPLTGETVNGLGILLYVLVLEAWIWYHRLQRDAQLDLVEGLADQEPSGRPGTAGTVQIA